jgi:hypothetical protein
MAARKVVVAAHGHCFDGLVSAAMFTHLRSRLDPRPGRFVYRSCGYGPNLQTVPDRWLGGDENAIVDFRYTPHDKLTWYFDHHVTAFASDAQRDEALARSRRYIYDPAYTSCTKLIVDTGRERFGVDFEEFADLVSWADRIDSAGFASAAEAIDRSHPVMQLSAVIEQHGDTPLFSRLVPELLAQGVHDVASSDHVQDLWKPIDSARQATHERIARGLQRSGDVVYVDLHEAPLEASGKFVAYALAPDCRYSVALIRMKQHFKLSVGYNPWGGKERRHDIGTLCQRHGGGGHPVVGAISVPLDKLDTARAVVRQVLDELGR